MKDLIWLRGLALLFSLQGKTKYANTLNALADAKEAGQNVDDFMGDFAEAMKTGDEPTMDEIVVNIRSEVSEFLSRGEDGKVPEDGSNPPVPDPVDASGGEDDGVGGGGDDDEDDLPT